jgi:hypothetical protein
MKFGQKLCVCFKQSMNHLDCGLMSSVVVASHAYPSSALLSGKTLGDCINIKPRLMNTHPSKSKLSSSNQLKLDEVVNICDSTELSHQLSKISRRRIPREHSVVNHRQNGSAVIDKFVNLRYSILKLNNSKASSMISPEVDTRSGGDLHESIHASFDALSFSNGIQLSTYGGENEFKY